MYPFLDSLDEPQRQLLLPQTHPSASIQYGIDHNLSVIRKKTPTSVIYYYAGVMRLSLAEDLVKRWDETIETLIKWAEP